MRQSQQESRQPHCPQRKCACSGCIGPAQCGHSLKTAWGDGRHTGAAGSVVSAICSVSITGDGTDHPGSRTRMGASFSGRRPAQRAIRRPLTSSTRMRTHVPSAAESNHGSDPANDAISSSS